MRRRRSVLAVLVAVSLTLVVIVAAQGVGRTRVRVAYDREAAVAYADAWALKANPRYWSSPDNDCANFVSQCLAAGGLRPTRDAGVEWHANGTEFPAIAWVNCAEQRHVLMMTGASHTRYIARCARAEPRGWAAGDVVHLGNTVAGNTEWQHVIIGVGKKQGVWVYDSHTAAHRRQPLSVWYPAHYSLIRYCRIADAVTYTRDE